MKYIRNLAAVVIAATIASACSGIRPDTLGVQSNNMFTPCPSSPNCVSSFALDKPHYIAPMQVNSQNITTKNKAKDSIKNALKTFDRIEIISETDNYIYAEATSKLMGYVDDLELLINLDEQIIHVKSASRLGYKDFNVNRERVERLREKMVSSGAVIAQ